MIFPEYGHILVYFVLLLLLSFSLWAYRVVKRNARVFQVPVRIVSIIVFGLTSLMTIMIASCEFSNSKSTPIYSQDHKRALRIYDYDYGATGGETEVFLFSYYGLR